MNERKSYPEEMFDLRLKRYRSKKRTKLPHQLELEICARVNRLAKKDVFSFVAHVRLMYGVHHVRKKLL
jgi:hypothetical protein